jgi:N,N'-diacetylchitobiose phosphorylase
MSTADWTTIRNVRVYLRDRERGAFWSAGETARGVESRVTRSNAGPALDTHRITITNRSGETRTNEVTFYAEVVLFPLAAQDAHPAFAKLFVQTDFVADSGTLLAGRRPRGHDESTLWLAAELRGDGPLEHETDRARFIGRGRDLDRPAALVHQAPLSGTTGNVLDPVIVLRRTVRLEPGATAELEAIVGRGSSRDEALSRLSPLGRGSERPVGRSDGSRADRMGGAFGEPDRGEAAGEREASRQSPPHPGPLPKGRGGEELQFENGYGGFSADGREYVIGVAGEQRPPMPWVNVIANEGFGCLVSESGAGATWSGNSRLNRLTPWSNDPIVDPPGERLLVRDEADGTSWSPQPTTADDDGVYEVRHGFGYSRWLHSRNGIVHEVTTFVPTADPVKITIVRLRNTGDRARKLAVVTTRQLVLGVLPEETAGSIAVEVDAQSGVIIARNPRREDFSESVTFTAVTSPSPAASPRSGSPNAPPIRSARLASERPTGRSDPLPNGERWVQAELTIELAPGATDECAFLLGECASAAEVREIVERYRRANAVTEALEVAQRFWSDLVSAVEVETPSPAIDLMMNGWLLYQMVSCRIWGRTAFYQSGGAFGFRDQLQDSAGLVYARSDMMRAEIVLHSGRQFLEGDVQHWWHPPAGRGTRTRCSDDLVWLPYLTSFYVHTTGDESVLDERTGFLKARTLEPGEDETYLLPSPAGADATVYEHCVRALERSLTVGANGLPLIGTCDWNDGFNRVGREGRGESVWLAFFLHATLEGFEPICRSRGESDRAERYAAHRGKLREAIEANAWDGRWYRRATYDDGTWLGSSSNVECKIDALAQSWAVISKVASPERASQAMDSAERELVDEAHGLIRLLTPPFDRAPEDPGYIKGYVPGIRENGGQYTHGALWVVRATAELGRRDRAARFLEMLTPVAHARDRAAADVYKVEPYVVVADIYGTAPHVGRGGWTWYTGSAAWMYRIALESILGFTVRNGDALELRPCVPDSWPRFRIRHRLPDGRTSYEIEIENPHGDASRPVSVSIDGAPGEIREGAAIVPLRRDGASHRVTVTLGS